MIMSSLRTKRPAFKPGKERQKPCRPKLALSCALSMNRWGKGLLPILRLGTFTGQRSSAGVDKKPGLNGWLSKSWVRNRTDRREESSGSRITALHIVGLLPIPGSSRDGKNIIPVHTPVHASWLNQVKIYFSVIQRKVLTPADSKSVSDLNPESSVSRSIINQLHLRVEVHSRKPEQANEKSRCPNWTERSCVALPNTSPYLRNWVLSHEFPCWNLGREFYNTVCIGIWLLYQRIKLIALTRPMVSECGAHLCCDRRLWYFRLRHHQRAWYQIWIDCVQHNFRVVDRMFQFLRS